ncbi:MAG: hypothetical protein QM758_01085 [Armatimonas sp.]
MKLLPGDLSPELGAELVARRVAASVGSSRTHGRRAMMNQTGPAFGPFQGFLKRSTGMTEPAATLTMDRVGQSFSTFGTVLSCAWGGALGMMGLSAMPHGLSTVAVVVPVLAAVGITLGQLPPRFLLSRDCKAPLQEAELDALLAAANDPLERAYFQLIKDTLRQSNLSESAENELRSALRALGDAMEQLPSAAPESAAVAPETLQAEAKALREKGMQESDQTVSDSLIRQADARERSANAISRSQQTLRRNAVLRDELVAQTEALRIGLAVQSTEQSGIGELANLAESARRVAAEATSLADARNELDSAPQKVRLG